MSPPRRRIAITGPGGRLGRALVRVATERGDLDPVGWGRPDLDLDAPDRVERLLDRDRPALVIHAAAWTDVDGCARDPELAMARNGIATGVIAQACAVRGVDLVAVSTNEVFDGERTDGRGYTEGDVPRPRNPYGISKLAGERTAATAYDGRDGLWIVRVAWLFGPPGDDFPQRIVAAADRLPPDQALPLVVDEVGCPTFTTDLAGALLRLVERVPGGTWHLAGGPPASRADWGEAVLRLRRPERSWRPVSRSAFVRASDVPAWGVLDSARTAALGIHLPPWREALAAYLGAGEA